MAKVSIDEYSCDRCGARERSPHGIQPTGWARVTVFYPVLAWTDSDPRHDLQVCLDCRNSFDHWRIAEQ